MENSTFVPPRPVTWREKYRVRIGFVMGVLFLWRVQPDNIFFLISGLIIAFIGVLIRQWAAGVVKKMNELAQTGPYALVRHPLYVGSACIAFGLIWAASSIGFSLQDHLMDRTFLFWALFWILLDSIYLHKVEREEENLAVKFAGSWQSYVQKVPRFIPKKLDWRELDFSSFSFDVWKHNREWGSIIGYAVLSLVLIMRYLYR